MKNKAAKFFAHCYRYLVVHQSTFDAPKSLLDKHLRLSCPWYQLRYICPRMKAIAASP
ncbi:hypothetical protein [Nostoc commune]|uniref:hypothetical protein n=1 Tax=Nostoc commune TaxID=1178 RepID=UPI0015E81DB4|nr:hypothetical protein [Nostoc commune]